MSAPAICTIDEIDPATREWLTRIFGRELPAEQKVAISLIEGDKPSEDAQRRAAWAEINRILDRAAANLKDVSDDEYDAALQEAMDKVRPRHRP
jgi:hypothetical protein